MITEKMIEELARAWASIDGKADKFDACKADPVLEDDLGHYGGYIAEAQELLRRSPTVSAALAAGEPVSSRNDEAGYVEFLNQDVPYIVRDIQGAVAILRDLETRNVIGYRVYDPDSVFAPHAPSVAEEIADAVLSWMEKNR